MGNAETFWRWILQQTKKQSKKKTKNKKNSSASIWRKSCYLVQREPAACLFQWSQGQSLVWAGWWKHSHRGLTTTLSSGETKDWENSKSTMGVGWARRGSLRKTSRAHPSLPGSRMGDSATPHSENGSPCVIIAKESQFNNKPGKEKELLVTAKREGLQISKPGFVTLALLSYYLCNSVISPSFSFLHCKIGGRSHLHSVSVKRFQWDNDRQS